jgi:hypothetical protein
MRVQRRAVEQLGKVGAGEAERELLDRSLDDSVGSDVVDVGGGPTRQPVEDVTAGVGGRVDDEPVPVGVVQFGDS